MTDHIQFTDETDNKTPIDKILEDIKTVLENHADPDSWSMASSDFNGLEIIINVDKLIDGTVLNDLTN